MRFNCLLPVCLLVALIYRSLARSSSPSSSKRDDFEPIYVSILCSLVSCVCVCGSPRDSCRKKQRGKVAMEFTVRLFVCFPLCSWLSMARSTFALLHSCELLLLCSKLCSLFLFFLFYCHYSCRRHRRRRCFSSSLFIYEACACVSALFSFYHLLRASVWARSSLILFFFFVDYLNTRETP